MLPIDRARPEEWSAAFEVALLHLDEDTRRTRVLNALTLVAAGEINPEGIFVARDETGVCAAQVCVALAGNSGLFWPPRSRRPDPALEDGLVQAALNWLGVRRVELAQALIPPADATFAQPLLRRGFQLVTQLHYLQHDLDEVPQPSPSMLALRSFSDSLRPLFEQAIERTYEGTLDCPEVNGIRTIEEVMEGHFAQGNFRPERWWLAFEEKRPVGVLLVTEVPEGQAWDLSYLGIVPEARGRGLGRELALHALQAARRSDALQMILAVDGRNEPALQLYRSLGFVTTEFRDVYLCILGRSLAEAGDMPTAKPPAQCQSPS